MNVIESDHLMKSYGRISALNDLSFSIEENKITGLIGRNGAGKTTLLKVIAGYLRPADGELLVYGRKPFNSLFVSQKVIFVDDQMSFPAAFTLEDITKEAGAFYPEFDVRLANGLLDYFSINRRQRHSNLSKGTKSTFNTIIGLASRCPLTLFDEPTTGMDSAVRKDFYRAMLKDYLERPRTILLSSHLLGEVEELLEDILLIDRGTKRLQLPVVELKEYAVGIRGQAQALVNFTEGKEVLHREEFGKGSLYVALKNDFSLEQLDQAKRSGLEVQPVSTNDLCVYLTDRKEGGIDDVFKRS